MRAWTEPEGGWPPRRPWKRSAGPSRYVLVFDTETADPDQRLLLLVWRLYVDGSLITEGIAHPDDLRGKRLAMLRRYVKEHQADTEPWARRDLLLIPLSEWIDRHLHRYGYVNRAAVVGYNLPFDIGTIAGGHWTTGRSGGFTFRLAPRYRAATGREQKVWHRPDLSVRHIDNGAFIAWTGCVTGERDHANGTPCRHDPHCSGTTPYRGRFVDCSTLHFALTGAHAGLDAACAGWGVDAGKIDCDFGVLDERLINHCRADVRATAELHRVLTAELAKHPGIELTDDALWSPATVAGRYLDAMRVRPLLDRFEVSPEVHAAARCASYGARTEARIVRHPVPVVALDVASMYPTVSALLGTWRLWTAREVVVEDCTAELAAWLATDQLGNDLYDPSTWKRWGCTLVDVEPSGDVLPHQYIDDAGKGRLVTAPLTFTGRLWWAWPDVAAAVLAGAGKVPKVTRALRLTPQGRQRGLRPVQLRGGLLLDPRRQDPFPFLVAARHRADDEGSAHLARFYKIAANALAHGLSGRYDHRGKLHRAVVHGPSGSAAQRVRMEQPGPHAFPAISSTTTAGARLILAMMERAITDLGGCWAHCDTDSAKVVATPAGGLVPCPGGPHGIGHESVEGNFATVTAPELGNATEGATEAVLALSWEQVRTIAARFNSLRPEGSRRPLWTVEHDSLTLPLMALVTGPKSYALFRQADAAVELVAWTETGLGESYLSPEPGWSADAWRWIVARTFGQEVELPAWWKHLALRREAAVNPAMARAAEASGVAARPFGFRLAGSARWQGGGSPIAPYSRNPAGWPGLDWRDRRTGEALAPMLIDEAGELIEVHGDRSYVGFTTLGSIVSRIERQSVPTFDDPASGEPAGRKVRGMLARRSTVAYRLVLVGADRTPLASKGEEPDQRYPTCQRCGKPLDGQSSQRWCDDACRKAARRSRKPERSTIAVRPPRVCHNAPDCAGDGLLSGRQREWCSKRCARAGERWRSWLERLQRIGGQPCSAEGCRSELYGGAVCTFHERRAS